MIGLALAHHRGLDAGDPMRLTDAAVPHPAVPRVGSLDSLLAVYDIRAPEARGAHALVVRYEDLHARAAAVLGGGFVDHLTAGDIAYADDRSARSPGAAAFGYRSRSAP